MLVFDAAAQDVNENMVVKTVKASLDVAFNYPLDPGKGCLDFRQCGMAGAFGGHGNRVPIVVRGRESRPQGEGEQFVSQYKKKKGV